MALRFAPMDTRMDHAVVLRSSCPQPRRFAARKPLLLLHNRLAVPTCVIVLIAVGMLLLPSRALRHSKFGLAGSSFHESAHPEGSNSLDAKPRIGVQGVSNLQIENSRPTDETPAQGVFLQASPQYLGQLIGGHVVGDIAQEITEDTWNQMINCDFYIQHPGTCNPAAVEAPCRRCRSSVTKYIGTPQCPGPDSFPVHIQHLYHWVLKPKKRKGGTFSREYLCSVEAIPADAVAIQQQLTQYQHYTPSHFAGVPHLVAHCQVTQILAALTAVWAILTF